MELHTVHIVVRGTPRFREMLVPHLEEAIQHRHPEGVDPEVISEAGETTGTLLADIDSGNTRTIAPETELVITSVDGEVAHSHGPSDVARFRTEMIEAIQRIKAANQARIIIVNASSFDPSDTTSNYQGATAEPASLRVHRLNLAAMHLSFDEGISVLDVDRLVAEIGGRRHVTSLLEYSAGAHGVILEELVNVLEDYGFFDDRPILEQVGSRA